MLRGEERNRAIVALRPGEAQHRVGGLDGQAGLVGADAERNANLQRWRQLRADHQAGDVRHRCARLDLRLAAVRPIIQLRVGGIHFRAVLFRHGIDRHHLLAERNFRVGSLGQPVGRRCCEPHRHPRGNGGSSLPLVQVVEVGAITPAGSGRVDFTHRNAAGEQLPVGPDELS